MKREGKVRASLVVREDIFGHGGFGVGWNRLKEYGAVSPNVWAVHDRADVGSPHRHIPINLYDMNTGSARGDEVAASNVTCCTSQCRKAMHGTMLMLHGEPKAKSLKTRCLRNHVRMPLLLNRFSPQFLQFRFIMCMLLCVC